MTRESGERDSNRVSTKELLFRPMITSLLNRFDLLTIKRLE